MEKSGVPTKKLSGPNPLNGVSQLSAEARFLRNASRLRQRGATTPHPKTPILLLLMRLFHSKPTRAAVHRSFAVSQDATTLLLCARLPIAYTRNRGSLADHNDVRPRTAVLTRGFDPSLSFGSARPAVFRSSTYVFESPEAAERAFAITTGKTQPAEGERADLIYSRFSHPNAEILEDQIVPLEAGGTEAAVFNSGMAAIMTAFFTFARPNSTIVYTTPLYGGTTGLIHTFMEPFGVRGIPVPSGDTAAIDEAIRSAKNCCIVYLETPANPTLIMTDIERAAETALKHPYRPAIMVDNTFLGPAFQHPLQLGADI